MAGLIPCETSQNARTFGLLAALLLGVLAADAGPDPRSAGVEEQRHDVVFVANAEGGTVSIVDAATFEVVRDIDVLPDGEDAQPGSDDPVQAAIGQRLAEAAGGDNFAQDQDLSPDGRTLYVSRGHRGDVAAFDLASGEMRWKVPISGFRADHMTLSEDGRHLYVSALTENVVEVIDTDTAEVVDSFGTGEWPHDNHFSHDGQRLYNGSIGNILTPRELRANRPAADPALPPPYVLTIVDADTLEVRDSHEFRDGIRPFVVTQDETRLFAQLSELHGLIEFDLDEGTITRELELPVDDGVTEDDYSFEAPHHGLAMTPDETTLCAAGRASDYVALVSTADFRARAIIDVDDAPSWAENSPDGRHCFVANTRGGTVSVISYGEQAEVARVETGEGPKHLEPGRVASDVLAGDAAEDGDGQASPDAAPEAAPDAGPDAGSDAGPDAARRASLPSTGAGAGLLGALATAAGLVLVAVRRPGGRATGRPGKSPGKSRGKSPGKGPGKHSG